MYLRSGSVVVSVGGNKSCFTDTAYGEDSELVKYLADILTWVDDSSPVGFVTLTHGVIYWQYYELMRILQSHRQSPDKNFSQAQLSRIFAGVQLLSLHFKPLENILWASNFWKLIYSLRQM